MLTMINTTNFNFVSKKFKAWREAPRHVINLARARFFFTIFGFLGGAFVKTKLRYFVSLY